MVTTTSLSAGLLHDFVRIRPNLRQSSVWIALAVLLLVGQLVAPAVSNPEHWPVLLRQAAPLGMLALGQTVLILGRGFDLSAGGVVGLVNVLAAGSLAQQLGAQGTMVFCLLLAAVIGAINGAIVAWGRLSPLIVTLGMGFILTGAMLIYTGGSPTGSIPEGIRALASGRIFGISYGVYIFVLIAVVLGFVLKFTWPGRWIYAIGTNPEAAEISGVNVALVKFGSHIFSSVCAAIGGLLLAGFVGIGTLGAGQDLLLNSLAAAVVGGTLLVGGKGGVSGTVGGVLLITYLSALLTGAGVGKAGELLTQGIVIIAAAMLFRRRKHQP